MRSVNMFIATLFILAVVSGSHITNDYPVIGIVSVPSDYPSFRDPNKWSYFQDNYVHFIESGGARVVPIPYDLPLDNLTRLFNQVNGIVLPGGGSHLWVEEPVTGHRTFTVFANQTSHIINLALEANAKGDHFPMWGTCLGLELLVQHFTENLYLLENYTQHDDAAETYPLPALYSSMMFSEVSQPLIEYIIQEDGLWSSHSHGLSPEAYASSSKLQETLEPIAIGLDDHDKPYFSALEGKNDLPIFMTQFHPERMPFDWFDSVNIPHSPQAMQIAQDIANMFVEQARKNFHKFESEEELQKMEIWNYPVHVVPENGIPTFFFPSFVNTGSARCGQRTVTCKV